MSLVEQDQKMEASPQLAPNLHESFDQAEHNDELSQDGQSYFGKLEQGESCLCPESVQEGGQQVEGLILYQTTEEETQMEKPTAELVETTGHPENSMKTAPVCLSEEVEELMERPMEHEPFMSVSLVQSCDEMAEKTVQHLEAKAAVMELDSIYSGFRQCSSPAPPPTHTVPPMTSAPDQGSSQNNEGVRAPVCVSREAYEGLREHQNLLPGIMKCKNTTSFHDQTNKDDDLQQDKSEMTPASPPNSKCSHPRLFLSSDSDYESKPQELLLPVKTEETKRESVEDNYPDSSDIKQGHFLSAVKVEYVVTKDEQLDYPVKAETLETKSELLRFPVKTDSLDSKAEDYAAFSGGTKLKTETKPEDLGFTTYPDSSEEKCQAKAEPLEFPLPEIKGKVKQELLEADSTVVTPKLEQSDGLVDPAASLVLKGQVKKLCPPGKDVI